MKNCYKMETGKLENNELAEWKKSFERAIDYLNEIKSIDEELNQNDIL
jgi:hypothetical protein